MATAQDGDKPLILRIRNRPPSFAGKATFRHLLAVSWHYERPNENGLPAQDIVERMAQLEDLLEEAFESAEQAFLTVIVTGNGVREWQWYARDPTEVMRLVNDTLGEYDPFPVQFSFQEDPEWEGYAQFREMRDS